jgi:hypothetical protein
MERFQLDMLAAVTQRIHDPLQILFI